MDKKKDKKKFLLGFILGGLIFGGISTYAATVLAEDVSFNVNANSSGQANNVKAALDELYNQIGPKYRGTSYVSNSNYEKSWDAVNDYDMVVKYYVEGNSDANQWLKSGLCLLQLSSDEQDCFEDTNEGIQKMRELFGNSQCNSGEDETNCYDPNTGTTCTIYHSDNSITCQNSQTQCYRDTHYGTIEAFYCELYESGE